MTSKIPRSSATQFAQTSQWPGTLKIRWVPQVPVTFFDHGWIEFALTVLEMAMDAAGPVDEKEFMDRIGQQAASLGVPDILEA